MSATVAAGRTGFRRFLTFVLLALLGFLLTTCGTGGGSHPFAKLDNGPSGKTVPPIYLAAISGLPDSKLQSLKDALSIAAGKRDMAIVEGVVDGDGFKLSGNFQILPDQASLHLAYNWTLTDKTGTVVHTIAAQEDVPGTAGPDPWNLVTPAVLERVSAYTAESLSNRLSKMGYATQIGGLPPPLENYAMASPNTDHDIDYETLYGPGKAVPVNAPPENDAQMSGLPPDPGDSAVSPAEDKGKSGRQEIRAVAVLVVKGASGEGNQELTSAMREALSSAGWPVVSRRRGDALTIAGKVDVGPKVGEFQKVGLAWTVALPDGETVGTVNQANTVPAGSLDGGWGESAIYATQAAATGIFDLVKKLR